MKRLVRQLVLSFALLGLAAGCSGKKEPQLPENVPSKPKQGPSGAAPGKDLPQPPKPPAPEPP